LKLTQEETSLWNSFSNSEKSYISTGDSAQSFDFTECQKAGFSVNFLPQVELQEEQDWQKPHLVFDPSPSDSDFSEDPDYVQPEPRKRIITTSDDSWRDNSNSQPLSPPSTSKQTSEQQEPSLDSDSATSSDSEPIQRTVKSHNNKDSWKSTSSNEWKPSKRTVITPDPESIATCTRSRHVQNVHDPLASHPRDLNIDSVCCDNSRQNHTEPSGGVLKNWALCYKCALSPRENTKLV
jgi:hypothetical protein